MWTVLWTALAFSAPVGDDVDVGAAAPGADQVVADARERLERGAVIEAVGLLLRHARQGQLDGAGRAEAARLLVRAADLLADRGEPKGAAVAADAAFALDPEHTDRRRLAGLILAWARTLADDGDDAGARALAERALGIDPDSAAAAALVDELAGMDTWVSGHVTLGASAALWIVSATAFVTGLERERLMRASVHTRAELDQLHLERSVAAAVAWPAAVAGAVSSGLGLALVLAHDPGPAPVWPHPFPALPPTTEAP